MYVFRIAEVGNRNGLYIKKSEGGTEENWMDMNYRKGTIADLDIISQLFEAAKEDMDNKGICQWDSIYPTREDYLEDIAKGTLYVVEHKEELIGVYVISEEADEAYQRCKWESPEDTACILHRFCVAPQYQYQGLGKEMLQHIEAQAREMSYESIRLDVFTQNPHALHLYEKGNYQERGYADWRKGRFLLMEKKLHKCD